MSTTVLPILASGSLDTISKAARARPIREWSGKAVDVGIAHCRQGLEAIRALRQEYGEKLHAGMDAKAFAAEIEALVPSLRVGASQLSRLVEDLRGPISDPPLREFQTAFETLAREAADLLGFLETALATATIPHRPIDWERVRKAEEAHARGETKTFHKSTRSNAKE